MKHVRQFVCLLGILLQGLVLDVLLRLSLLRNRRASEERRVRALNPLIRLWGVSNYYIVRSSLRGRLRVIGTPPPDGRYIIVSNHQSSIDCPLLMAVFRGQNLKFVSKEELRYGKIAVSVALRNGGFVFVGKEDSGQDLAALVRFGQDMERFDGSPALFPEGWRTDDGEMRPFLNGGVEAVRRGCRLPILPVTIDGLWRARTIFDLKEVVGATVTVRISDPIPSEEVERDPRAAYAALEETIRRNLEEIRGGGGS